MLAAERQQRILDMLLKANVISTTQVAKALRISEETARRDFEALEADGKLSRRHGGAIRADESHRELSLHSREAANIAEKKNIASLARQHIQAGDTVFFDASSTVFHLACQLPNLEITVLTSALNVAVELARRPAVQVILTGGAVKPSSLSCQGNLAELILEQCHVQKAFLSCRGLDAKRGLSEATIGQAALKRKVMDLAEQTILLADTSKIGVKSSFFYAKLEAVDTLITECEPDNAIRHLLEKTGKKLILPGEK